MFFLIFFLLLPPPHDGQNWYQGVDADCSDFGAGCSFSAGGCCCGFGAGGSGSGRGVNFGVDSGTGNASLADVVTDCDRAGCCDGGGGAGSARACDGGTSFCVDCFVACGTCKNILSLNFIFKNINIIIFRSSLTISSRPPPFCNKLFSKVIRSNESLSIIILYYN